MTVARARKKAFAGLNRRLAAMGEKGKTAAIRVDMFDVLSVLLGDTDPRIRPGAMQYLQQALQTVNGTTEDKLTCFCCCRTWSRERVLSAFLVAEFIGVPGTPSGLLAGVCHECVGDHALITRCIKRDLTGTSGEVHFLPEGGHA